MAQLWLNSDYVKCIHASGELFSGYLLLHLPYFEESVFFSLPIILPVY